jgi:hypothetical protein
MMPMQIVEMDGGVGMTWFALAVAAAMASVVVDAPPRPGYSGEQLTFPGLADADDPLAREFTMPPKIWGFKLLGSPYLATVDTADTFPWAIGWSPVFFSLASLQKLLSIMADCRTLEPVWGLSVELRVEEALAQIHPSSRGIMLLEWDGSEIGRVPR